MLRHNTAISYISCTCTLDDIFFYKFLMEIRPCPIYSVKCNVLVSRKNRFSICATDHLNNFLDL